MIMQKANQRHPPSPLLEMNYQPPNNQWHMINTARHSHVHQAHLMVDIIA